ncbi:DUF1287 domain-containing protein [Lysobacter brunescens]|uniref:DUF1287 domain-containing protein n=1 Tax=Lysobacter brunescens TaxID=262323 RepID=A0ABW2YEQ4_9GAMM
MRRDARRRMSWLPVSLRVSLTCTLAACMFAACSGSEAAPTSPGASARAAITTRAQPRTPVHPRVAAARRQIGVTLLYDPAYVVLPYPGGDVPESRGVCTDVVIRALRAEGIDLQKTVHEDMRAHFDLYPKKWGLRRPDRNIDHRRVPNLQTWFARQGWSLTPSQSAAAYKPGDLVTWMLPGNLPHIGIVGDRTSSRDVPLIIHNIGSGTREEDILFAYPITGHYRNRAR